jgi:hypothetical protein
MTEESMARYVIKGGAWNQAVKINQRQSVSGRCRRDGTGRLFHQPIF